MLKRQFFLTTLLALLAACGVPQVSPEPITLMPISTAAPPSATPPPAPTALPSATRLPPSPTPSASPVPASPTPAADTGGPLEQPIAPLAAGQPVTIARLSMLSATEGWAISLGQSGADAHVLRTADGGQTWSDVTPPEPAGNPDEGGKQAVGSFLDIQNAWVTYFSPGPAPTMAQVWSTGDGGLTWTPSAPLQLTDAEFYGPSDLVRLDERTGWLLSHVGAGMMHDYIMLYRTDDGGLTWPRLVDPFGDQLVMSCSKTGLAFAPDGLAGWLTGDCFGVQPGAPQFQVTDDGGKTWRQLDLPAPADQPDLFKQDLIACGTYAPDLAAPPLGRLVMQCRDYTHDPGVDQTYQYLTRDGGQTWQVILLGDSLAAAYFRGQDGWVQTGNAAPYALWRTGDGGQSFARGRDLNWKGTFSFVDGQTGWAVARADDGSLALVRTTDGGARWRVLQPVIAP